jgi:hypothetical protein
MPDRPDFSSFMQALREALRTRIAADWQTYRDALDQLTDRFLKGSRADLERWTGLLAAGSLTRDDFEWLVEGRKDLARVEVLRDAGLSFAQIDRLRAAVVETVVGTAFRAFL